MRYFMKIYILFLIGLLSVTALAAVPTDTLQNKTLSELDSHIDTFMKVKDTANAMRCFRIYTRKAQATNDTEALVHIYRSMAIWQSEFDKKLQYADSAIAIAQYANNNELMGSAIYTKGVVYYKYNDWAKTLEHYVLANEYFKHTHNQYLIHKVKYGIGQAHYSLGNYEEAMLALESCINYFGSQNDNSHKRGLLSSLHMYGIVQNRAGHYRKCSEINALGIQKCKEFKNKEMEILFLNSEALNKYSLKLYRESIDELEKNLPYLIEQENERQEMLSWFFMGKNYVALGDHKKAIYCFEKVDSLFAQTNYLRDDMAENYYYLIEDAQRNKNLKSELYYTNRLIDAEKLLSAQYKDIAVRIQKYDTDVLLATKARIENALRQKEARNKWLVFGISIISLSMLILLMRHFKEKRKFEILYRQFIEAQKERSKLALELHFESIKVKSNASGLELKEETVAKILKKLEQFELNKEFLKEDLTMAKLAKSMKTNVKYLSKVIQDYKHKDYVRYINDLRIDYLTEMLKSPKYQNYSIEGYAKELGFSSTKGFNRAFEESTGMKFSLFLKKYQKENYEHLANTA